MILYTKSQLVEMKTARFNELLAEAGDKTHLSKMLGLPYTQVSYWVRKGFVTPHGANLIASHPTLGKKFTVEYLCPELETLK